MVVSTHSEDYARLDALWPTIEVEVLRWLATTVWGSIRRDLAQDAWIALRLRWHHPSDPYSGLSDSELVGIAIRAARNKGVDAHRSRRSEQTAIDRLLPPEDPQDHYDGTGVLPIEDRDLIDKLRGRKREVIALKVVDGLRTREIAEELGITQSAVQVHARRARAALRSAFAA